MQSKTLKVQSLEGGFRVHTNTNGKTMNMVKGTLEELVAFTEEFFKEQKAEKSP